MKKLLLGTTALVLLSGAAAAQQVTTSSPFTVTLGGSVRYNFGIFDEDGSNVNRESSIDSRITLNAEAKADNGLTYGFTGRIRTQGGQTGSDSNRMIMDYKYIYAGGSWGTVYLGDADDARTAQEVLLYTVGIGQADFGGFVTAGAQSMFWANEGNFDTKITYLTPTFSGFTAGVSYTPEVGDSGRGISKSFTPAVGATAASGTPYADYVEGAAAYSGTFGSVSLKVGGGIGKVLTSRQTGAGDDANWNVGAQLGFAGFTGSAFYFDNNDYLGSAGDDVYSWGAGVAYETGPFGVGLSYIATTSDSPGVKSVTDHVVGLGGAYKLAPGLSLQGDLNYFATSQRTSEVVGGNDGYQLLLRTRVDF
jgi:outer membrane protein OmpU